MLQGKNIEELLMSSASSGATCDACLIPFLSGEISQPRLDCPSGFVCFCAAAAPAAAAPAAAAAGGAAPAAGKKKEPEPEPEEEDDGMGMSLFD
jgi:ribosomal protein L12E/L44/L45/RPP1/RPP2